jgi:hypothetical protein
MFSIWHGRRVPALLEIYEAFRKHLDFLRRHLYFTTAGGDMSPYHELRLTLDQQLVFLDDDLAHRIRRLESELLEFWNWALEQRALGSDDLSNVRHRLDFEIPSYLDQLRRLINIYATDGQIGRDGDPQVPNEGMHPTAQRPGGG